MADHLRFQQLATRLIAKHGRLVTFKRVPPADSPLTPWRGTAGAPVPITVPLMAVFVPHKGLDFGTDFVDEQLLKMCTEVCMVAGGDVELEPTHVIEDGGVDFKVAFIRKLRPADQTLVYVFGVER